MSSSSATVLLRAHSAATPQTHSRQPIVRAASSQQNVASRRKLIVTTFLATSVGLVGLHATTPQASLADQEEQKWGTRSFILEKFFMPGLSPEDAVARIRNTAEGLHSLREMIDTMSWRYVIFYIRVKQSYLSQDLRNAFSTIPQGRRKDFVKMANELVDNMAEFDHYVRTPKVYESYLFYEKTLESIDRVVALL
uniref:Photosynthetic NDH subcomplex L 2 n=1 Tax=Pelargonium echinatum TaxID=122254 RepID=A0A0F7GY17_9ROSI